MDTNRNLRRHLRSLDGVDRFLAVFLGMGSLVSVAMFTFGLSVSVETFGLLGGILAEALIGIIALTALSGFYLIVLRDWLKGRIHTGGLTR